MRKPSSRARLRFSVFRSQQGATFRRIFRFVQRPSVSLSHDPLVPSRVGGDHFLVVENPTRGIKSLRENGARVRFLDQEEIRRLIEAASEDFLPILMTALHAGGPDELFVGKENVIEGIFEKLKVVHSGLIVKAG